MSHPNQKTIFNRYLMREAETVFFSGGALAMSVTL